MSKTGARAAAFIDSILHYYIRLGVQARELLLPHDLQLHPGLHFLPVPPKKKPDTTPHYNVADRVTVTLHTGQLVNATIRAIIERTDGARYQVDYGHDQTALLESWRLHPPSPSP
jgi:hypothetical protein